MEALADQEDRRLRDVYKETASNEAYGLSGANRGEFDQRLFYCASCVHIELEPRSQFSSCDVQHRVCVEFTKKSSIDPNSGSSAWRQADLIFDRAISRILMERRREK